MWWTDGTIEAYNKALELYDGDVSFLTNRYACAEMWPCCCIALGLHNAGTGNASLLGCRVRLLWCCVSCFDMSVVPSESSGLNGALRHTARR
jgi:hypothetical protein